MAKSGAKQRPRWGHRGGAESGSHQGAGATERRCQHWARVAESMGKTWPVAAGSDGRWTKTWHDDRLWQTEVGSSIHGSS
jgi:hypothetical protein